MYVKNFITVFRIDKHDPASGGLVNRLNTGESQLKREQKYVNRGKGFLYEIFKGVAPYTTIAAYIKFTLKIFVLSLSL